MNIGIMTLDIYMADTHSLKEKRRIVQSLKSRLRSKFNVSVCETGFHDLWQKGQLTIAAVGMEKSLLAAVFNRIDEFVSSYDLRVIQTSVDYLK